ncbi:MAG: glycoside hydrolase family 3 C-terminal domain-containing protein [Bacteroidetes bacterium]|nr:glycoside hydrolase family 3 C-terminal domain-containing protein [Bacteroidota bacterium]
MKKKISGLSIKMLICFCVFNISVNAQHNLLPYKNPGLSVEERVNDLLKRMTLDEKIAQMTMTNLAGYKNMANGAGVCESPFESIYTVARNSARSKKYARENTRLGIPFIQIGECLHGQLAYGATIFPQAIAQGSTWNAPLIEEMGSVIAYEASTSGVDQALSPLFDIIRDPRYGRTEESYSEDPYMVGKIGSAFVIGMQGKAVDTKKRIEKDKVFCTAKHFAGYSAPQAGINLAPASIGEREMRSMYLFPFEKVVKEANIYSIMPSYSEVDGIPAHANKFLLTKVLRNEWNFSGYVFSDYGGVSMIMNFHNTAKDKPTAAVMAINAGVDLEASSPDIYASSLKELVKSGKVSESLIDTSVKRILSVKFKAGLFEKPYADTTLLKSRVHTQAHIDLAQRIAEESIILLKNENQLLPLDISKLKSLAVIGPNADQVQYGDYTYTRDNKSGVTVLQGIKSIVGDKVKINYAKGCGLSSLSKDGFGDAINAANNSDAVVMVVGETSVILSGLGWGKGPGMSESEDPFTTGEGYDVTDLNPTGVQRDLIQAIYKTGKPIILVMVHGRPWSISWEKKNIPAILEAWFPGERGGAAIANILFGNVNPSGRLNVSVPQSVGHIPVSYNYKPSSKGINREPGTPEKAGRDYVFSSPDPLFTFGFGLSYTTFEYSNLKVSKTKFSAKDEILVDVDVKNTGMREGKEVVQLYIRDLVSSVETPVKQLKGFEKINLKSGELKTVRFKIVPQDLSLWNVDMKFITEPGVFDIMIGRSADDVVLSKSVEFVE